MSDIPAARVNQWAHDIRGHVHSLRVAFHAIQLATEGKSEVANLLVIAERQFETIKQIISKMAAESGPEPDAQG